MLLDAEYLIYPARKKCTVRIKPTDRYTVLPEGKYTIRAVPSMGIRTYASKRDGIKIAEEGIPFTVSAGAEISLENNSFNVEMTFPQEDRYYVFIRLDGEKIADFELYAVEEDLYGLLPLRGDFHTHTIGSDGTASPETMAASGCERGYDFIAVTDHRNNVLSVKANKQINSLNCGFTVIKGEESNVGGCPLHFLTLGSDYSINYWFEHEREDFDKAVAEKRAAIEDSGAIGISYDLNGIAVALAVFERIRENGGTSAIAHPYWIVDDGFSASDNMLEYLLDHRTFDAIEIFAGGATREGSDMQLCRYNEIEDMPIIGDSDSHHTYGDRPLCEYYTIVFAKDNSEEEILSAVRAGRTLVVDRERIFGSYRLARYAYYLRDRVFPLHDRKSGSLAALMWRYAEGKYPDGSHLKQFAEAADPTEVLSNAFYKE